MTDRCPECGAQTYYNACARCGWVDYDPIAYERALADERTDRSFPLRFPILFIGGGISAMVDGSTAGIVAGIVLVALGVAYVGWKLRATGADVY
jgi:hypothetical protein